MSLPQRLARPASERALLQRLARLYEQAPDAVLIATADGAASPGLSILHVNAAFVALSGYASDEMVGRAITALEPDCGDGALAHLVRAALRDRRPARAELAMRRKAAPPCPVEIDLLPVEQDDDGVCGLVLVLRDISTRHNAERANRQAQAQLRDAVDNINDGVAFFDADDRLVICNERYVQTFPHLRQLGELTGRRFEELERHGATHGDIFSRDMMREPEKWIAARLERYGAATGHSHMRLLPDGRWLQTVENRTADGGIISVLTDMTPAKQAETRLRDAIESLDAVFTLWDDEARLLMWNKRFPETWPDLADLLVPGVTQRALIERNIERGVLPVAAEERERYVQNRIDLHQLPASEIELERADGRIFLIRSQKTAEGGQVRLETEITAAKRHERELRIAKETPRRRAAANRRS
jgi:PAS domain S-box-containing protein